MYIRHVTQARVRHVCHRTDVETEKFFLFSIPRPRIGERHIVRREQRRKTHSHTGAKWNRRLCCTSYRQIPTRKLLFLKIIITKYGQSLTFKNRYPREFLMFVSPRISRHSWRINSRDAPCGQSKMVTIAPPTSVGGTEDLNKARKPCGTEALIIMTNSRTTLFPSWGIANAVYQVYTVRAEGAKIREYVFEMGYSYFITGADY